MSVYIYGKFKDITNEDVYVDIWSNGYDANSTFEIEDQEHADIYFADDPIHISTSEDNVTTEIIKHSCTISFLSKIWMGDYLFASNPYEIKVLVYTDNAVLFCGFVQPVTYSQDFSEVYNQFDIECVDLLGCLEYNNYLNNNYELAKLNADIPTFETAVERMNLTYSFNSPRKNVTTNLLYLTLSKGTEQNFNLRFNDLVFLDESEDDQKTDEEALSGILRYLGLRIVQDGASVMIYDVAEVIRNKGANTFYIYNMTQNSWIDNYAFANSHVFSEFVDKHLDISMSDVYTQMTVNCSRDSVDTVVESPFESENISSPYTSRSHYMTEFSSSGEGNSAHNAFKQMLTDESIDNVVYDGAWTKEWYFRYLKNTNWIFNDINNTNMDSLNYQNQIQYMKYLKDNTGASLLCELGNTDKKTIKNKTVESKYKGNNFIVISINGNGKDGDNQYPSSDYVVNDNGMIIYNNYNNVNYSPVDSGTTNYLIFTGKLQYAPRTQTTWLTNLTDRYSTTFKDLKDGKDGTYQIQGNNLSAWGQSSTYYYSQNVLWHNTVPSEENGDGRYYAQKYDLAKNILSISPLQEDKKLQELTYNYSAAWDNTDKVKKLSVLWCRLRIGNKYLKEDFVADSNGIQQSQYSWVTDSTAQFTLGVDPEIGDNIIGQDFDFANNISVEQNLSTQGMAIPINFDDKLSGELEFKILGLVDNEWNEITRRHPTMFRHSQYSDNYKSILSRCSALFIKSFGIKIETDGGGYQSLEDRDLVYLSDENQDYVRNKLETDFDIHTGLTQQEAYDLGCENKIYINTVFNNDNSPCLAIYSAKMNGNTNSDGSHRKAEQDYIDKFYDFISTPQRIINYSYRLPASINLKDYTGFAKINNITEKVLTKEIDYDVRNRVIEASGYAL